MTSIEPRRFSWKKYLKFTSLVCGFGILPILMYWAFNLGQVKPSVVIKPMLLIALIVVVLFHLLLAILHSLKKATLLMLLVIFLFFTYGHLVQAIPDGSAIKGSHLLVIYLLIFLVGTPLIINARTLSENLFTFFEILGLVLLLFNLFKIIRYDPRITKDVKEVTINLSADITPKNQPDIYFIVLDSYSRADVLQDDFGFDNSEFLQALEERGFFIPDCAMSNYEETPQAIPSILNFDYLDELGIAVGSLGRLTASNTNLVLNNRIRQIFGDMGYQFVTARGWAPFDDIADSDIYLNYYDSQDLPDMLEEESFNYVFWKTTLVQAVSEIPSMKQNGQPDVQSDGKNILVNNDNQNLFYENEFWYHQTKYTFDALMNLPEDNGPYLVYAHINSPHGPYVFDRDGSFRFTTDLSNEKSLYLDMLVYTNNRTLELIDTLIENSDTPPIIIIQADHGSHIFHDGIEKHKILSAYYLPGNVDIKPYDTISPVNNFRIILHDYFDSTVELLPDQLYVYQDGKFAEMISSCDIP